MPVLVELGVVELTLGVLSGWLMLARHRARQPQRIRQGHIDLLMMGTILVALGAAIPSPPAVAVALIAFGSLTAPLLFFPLAVRPSLGDNAAYRLADHAGFVALSAGYLVLAADVLAR